MKGKIVIALILLNVVIWSQAANAGNIIVSTVSHHTGTYDYNNKNPGLGYEKVIDEEKNLWFGGIYYKNSYDKNSSMFYVSKRFPTELDTFTPHLSLGIADNYEDDANSFGGGFLAVPLVGSDMKINNKVSLRFSTSAPFSAAFGGDTVSNLSLVFPF